MTNNEIKLKIILLESINKLQLKLADCMSDGGYAAEKPTVVEIDRLWDEYKSL